MHLYSRSLLVVAFLLHCSLSAAQAISGPPPPAPVFPSAGERREQADIVIDGVTVEPTLSALRMHAESLRRSNPARYAVLDERIDRLETHRTVGWSVFAGSLLVGGGLIATSAIAAGGTDETLGTLLLVSGIVIAGGGSTLGLSILPTTDDLRRVASSNGGARSSGISLGLLPLPSKLYAALRLQL